MSTISEITKGQQVKVTHANAKSELATVDSVVEGDFPAVYVTYTDRTTALTSQQVLRNVTRELASRTGSQSAPALRALTCGGSRRVEAG